ncbi:PGF-CTERM sorting domain-containing protein [Haloprofundus halobius]|uniref:PGF-CTERM sorting domain-containing protein n=1 Tax=Haloprofundus halobius TaxID=2876194 RepID=UPI001CCCF396|nr:PGF-CTERM sorting domain-containing protein [Haloprofundus halobius]
MRRVAAVVAVLVVLSTAAPAVSGQSGGAESDAYAGANVSFETNGSAIADYAVGGDTVLESVVVQSQSEAKRDVGVGADTSLSTVSSVDWSALSMESKTETSASVEAESGASLDAHDNEHGILVVDAGEEEGQFVHANVSDDADADAEGDRVVVTTANGTTGAFVVVGDGEVTVTEDGNVGAQLGADDKLVFRSYEGERSEDDREQERLVSEGTAAAEVHVMQRDGETVSDVVSYADGTTVETAEQSENAVRMTVDRSSDEGTVLLTSVSETAENVSVTVDGEAAAEASSYGELESAANGGDSSAYMVSEGSADASADVLVAVNHFSEREIAVDGSDEGTTDDGSGEETTDGDSSGEETTDGESTDNETGDDGDATTSSTEMPGFGVGAGLLAVVLSAFALVRRA